MAVPVGVKGESKVTPDSSGGDGSFVTVPMTVPEGCRGSANAGSSGDVAGRMQVDAMPRESQDAMGEGSGDDGIRKGQRIGEVTTSESRGASCRSVRHERGGGDVSQIDHRCGPGGRRSSPTGWSWTASTTNTAHDILEEIGDGSIRRCTMGIRGNCRIGGWWRMPGRRRRKS